MARRLLLALLAVLALAGCGGTMTGESLPEPEVTIFLDNRTGSPATAAMIRQKLAAMPGVKQITFAAGEQAYEQYLRLTAGKPARTADSLAGAYLARLKDEIAIDAVKQTFGGSPGVAAILP
ncbi:permease-like cell division protein FtsX [Amycolatopsis samaneae]|uniref:Permease-like cell division protein FtsX n=1 Tax=Amycolatopsis samaneae TaxID=664691 RepID=A0ABW5GIS0_9PSEU